MNKPSWLVALCLSLLIGAPSRAAGEPGELIVFTAASLKEPFQEIAKRFEAKHAEMSVKLNLAGSQELRVQIENGAPADVFASADVRHMAALQEKRLAGVSAIFARNELTVVVPAKNPAGVATLQELPKAKRIVLGAPEVPIGEYTRQMLGKAGKRFGLQFSTAVEANVVSRELSVRQVLAKVSLGEADAGVVYVTDARTARGSVREIPIPLDLNVIAEYPIAVLSNARRGEAAEAWMKLVLSPEGQGLLLAAGFRPGAIAAGRGE